MPDENARFIARTEAVAQLISGMLHEGNRRGITEQPEDNAMTMVFASMIVRAIEESDRSFQETQHT